MTRSLAEFHSVTIDEGKKVPIMVAGYARPVVTPRVQCNCCIGITVMVDENKREQYNGKIKQTKISLRTCARPRRPSYANSQSHRNISYIKTANFNNLLYRRHT